MKTVTTRLLITAASGAALALTLGTGAASASVPVNGPAATQAVTQVSGLYLDGGGGTWAYGSVGRNLTVTQEGNVSSSFCEGQSPCQEFSATVDDGQVGRMNSGNIGGQPRFAASPGSFVTIPGDAAPNQYLGGTIQRQVTGSFTGEVHYAQFFTASPDGPRGRRVPTQLRVYDTLSDSVQQWPALEWPAGTQFFDLSPTSFSYSFRTTVGHQTWIESDTNDYGQTPFAGNITG